MAQEIRLFRGARPPVEAASGMIWAELRPGSERWIEIPQEFVSVHPEPAPDVIEPAAELVSNGVREVAAASPKKFPLWVFPGIPIGVALFNFIRGFFKK